MTLGLGRRRRHIREGVLGNRSLRVEGSSELLLQDARRVLSALSGGLYRVRSIGCTLSDALYRLGVEGHLDVANGYRISVGEGNLDVAEGADPGAGADIPVAEVRLRVADMPGWGGGADLGAGGDI